ncbi:esterase [Rhabdobacter roseus]|uniref:Putative esterase n=1 Tax=Rhabdobacter roseus TaxID=1655419 RepID=A0A840TZK1_9BACT|nr:phospholipase [Rhabdobacter roseus]MBB5285330.1 putative esterase [Rhabdobacter roseus]
MKQHNLVVSRTARYFTLGELQASTRRVWFVLHGYGQLAEHFLRKFEVLQDEHTLIVAPEALSRFYSQSTSSRGTSERVGASWMTREERQSEIDDYVAYLDALYQAVFQGYDDDQVEVTILGFSQGTATACRWLDRGRPHCQRLILWAGYFAHGLTNLINPDQLPAQSTYYVYGTRDEYLAKLDAPKYLANLQREVPSLQVLAYEGGHSINPEVLAAHFR